MRLSSVNFLVVALALIGLLLAGCGVDMVYLGLLAACAWWLVVVLLVADLCDTLVVGVELLLALFEFAFCCFLR